jgi:glycine betaine/proline transport system ATP-binding protein
MEANEHKEPKIRVEDLVMIFGRQPRREALPLLKEGVEKDEILARTGHVVGVSNASFTVQEGEIFVVMGLSGSGKSTLIRCVNRLIEPTSGQVYIDGEDVLQVDKQRLRQIRRTKMAMVFQHFALLPHKTVWENVAYGLKIRGVSEQERRSRALESLDLVGLKPWADRHPANLSGGMKQRVGLARALAMDADILLMDEAFGALDPLIRRQMQNELLQLQEALQKTVLFITHDLNEALRVGNHVAIMKDGEIVQIGTPVEIITEPATNYVAAFVQDVDQSRVLTAEVVMKPADVLVLGRDAVQTAVSRMKAKDAASHFYVVNEQKQIEGLLSRHRILRDGKADNKDKDLSRYLEREYPSTYPGASLTELYALVAHGVPVAVIDASGRLMGTVHASDVLSSLATIEEIGGQADEEQATGIVTGNVGGNGSNGNGAQQKSEDTENTVETK